METEEGWRRFLGKATKKEAYEAIDEMGHLARNFSLKHKPTGDRLYGMLNAGKKIYAERFGNEWVPF
ncbi:MAG: hypothetical protein OEV73_00235 [Desulfobulbaceae bacterium]|nr:hypothetical protein [Desulfobulbaceae bacterium]